MAENLQPSPFAYSERGKRINHTEAEVTAALKVLVLKGGSQAKAAALLQEEGLDVTPRILQAWRDNQFPRLYMRVRKELGRDVGEQVAGRALERAMEADDAEKAYIREAAAKVGEVSPDHLAKNALALANTKGQNVEKAQLLRHEPTEIVETRDVGEILTVLERLGVAERPKRVEVQQVEEEGAEG